MKVYGLKIRANKRYEVIFIEKLNNMIMLRIFYLIVNI